eukprot:CAMPEP_0173068152 /NCGR_PEP_ID=MMETSP1102-20130122/7240_1 /TAXON_ID=49646 /ORGANISM="Geminigera sp., Strain Caron Lab Isolate" /LENGTH=386 /DNA_ID=CAMNT_0013935953 /DNA_START=54 /DNA_END=1211 /DNA_ORIENTATION=-
MGSRSPRAKSPRAKSPMARQRSKSIQDRETEPVSEVDTEYINAVVARLFEPDTQDTPEDDDWISKLEVQVNLKIQHRVANLKSFGNTGRISPHPLEAAPNHPAARRNSEMSSPLKSSVLRLRTLKEEQAYQLARLPSLAIGGQVMSRKDGGVILSPRSNKHALPIIAGLHTADSIAHDDALEGSFSHRLRVSTENKLKNFLQSTVFDESTEAGHMYPQSHANKVDVIQQGWLWKKNSNAEGTDEEDWRERLCFLVPESSSQGARMYLRYQSEKSFEPTPKKLCDISRITSISAARFPEADKPYAFIIKFTKALAAKSPKSPVRTSIRRDSSSSASSVGKHSKKLGLLLSASFKMKSKDVASDNEAAKEKEEELTLAAATRAECVCW